MGDKALDSERLCELPSDDLFRFNRRMTDLDKLDAFLSSEEASENSMALLDLDGFLHGVVCTPEPMNEWLEIALGTTQGVPSEIIRIIVARFEEIDEHLEANLSPAEPVFWEAKKGHVIAMDWCTGFMDAVKRQPDVWSWFTSTPNGAKLMTPILVHMIDEEGKSMFQIPQEELDEALGTAAKAIPNALPAIYREIRTSLFQKGMTRQ